jgi:site-specific DNA recombinase
MLQKEKPVTTPWPARARALHVTGGAVYGYDNLEVLSPEPGADGRRKRLYVVRRINPDQAAIVRRIFEMHAAGLGLTPIAKTLNGERLSPPRKGGRGWAPSAVREMLYRPLYRGEVVWNKSQKVVRGGTKKQQKRPEGEWLRLEAPELRIISEDLWHVVHTRLASARATRRSVSCLYYGLGHPALTRSASARLSHSRIPID